MPELSPEKMQAARRKKAEERAQEAQQIAERKARLAAMEEKHAQLVSAVGAIYEEVDKLARKWPTMPVSQLTVDRTNKAIRAVQDLLRDETDDFVKDMTEIIPAGDMPENRDVIIRLAELKAALERFEGKHQRSWEIGL